MNADQMMLFGSLHTHHVHQLLQYRTEIGIEIQIFWIFYYVVQSVRNSKKLSNNIICFSTLHFIKQLEKFNSDKKRVTTDFKSPVEILHI